MKLRICHQKSRFFNDPMIHTKAYKFRLQPTTQQETYIPHDRDIVPKPPICPKSFPSICLNFRENP